MSRPRRSHSKESEYRRTAGGVDPTTFDTLATTSAGLTPSVVTPPVDPQSWTRYYERKDLGMSTDVIDTNEAQRTTSLILQQASAMASQKDEEAPLLYSTQTAATVADLEMEDENKEPATYTLLGEGTGQELQVAVSPTGVVTQVRSPAMSSRAGSATSRVAPLRAPSNVSGTSITNASILAAPPYTVAGQQLQPYNSSQMYEDNRLPAYVDYLGSILPILDQQSLANWPGTPHPLMGQVRIMPFNRASMPTVPYVLNIGDRGLLPNPIRGQAALSEVASTASYGAASSSVSNPNVSQAQAQQPVPAITYPETPKESPPKKDMTKKKTNKSDFLIETYKGSGIKTDGGGNKPPPPMDETVPYTDTTVSETPFIDFMLPLNPPVRVSLVYSGRTTLLSEKDNQMLLMAISSLEEAYGTKTFAIDKVTAEVYAVRGDQVTPIGLQGYSQQEEQPLEGAVGFAPQGTSTPREEETSVKTGIPTCPPELSTIQEQSEVGTQLSRAQFLQNRKQFRDQVSISSASEIIYEITKEQVDRAYKKKAACSQRLTSIFQNWQKEKELAQSELEKEGIDEFYEGYHAKYAAKLLSWQDVIDMYSEQELQKINEEKERKEQEYYDSRNRMRPAQPQQPVPRAEPQDQTQTSVKEVGDVPPTTPTVPQMHTETRTVSSSGTITTPTT